MSLIDTPLDATEAKQVWPPPRSLDGRLAEVVGLVNVCTAEMVGLIGEALATGAWEGMGIRSPEHWVTWRCGVSPTRARRLVTLARKLTDLPETRRVFTAGELTEDQTAVIVRHTDAAHDAAVAALAVSCTVPQLNRVLPTVPRSGPHPPPDPADPAGPAGGAGQETEVRDPAPEGGGHGTAGDGGADPGTDGGAGCGGNAAGGVTGNQPRGGAGCAPAGDGAGAPGGAGHGAGAGGPGSGPAPSPDLGNRRLVSMGYGDDGGFWCSIRLPGDEGALVERALTEARDVEFRERHPDADAAAVETREGHVG